MKNKNRIPAFTIMELTVAMLISAIVIGLMYSAYAIISKSYLSFVDRNNNASTLAFLDRRLSRDIDKAEIIWRDSNTVTMRSNKDTVIYRFRADRVIRQKLLADTFKVSTDGLSTSFESVPVDGNQSNTGEKKIDDLQIVLLAEGQKIPYHYHKTYSSVNLLQPLN
jgi:Tfp pilus assembly protein PilW